MKKGHEKIAELLINNENCNINEKDEIGMTALHWGYISCLLAFFQIVFKIIFLAIYNYAERIAELLLKNEVCNINEKNSHGDTALHLGNINFSRNLFVFLKMNNFKH